MGSLPNLHELEEIERRREKRREREQREQLREQRARDSSRERERMALFAQRKQNSYNAYLMAGLGMGGGTLGMAAAVGASHLTGTAAATGVLGVSANTPATTATTTLGGFAVGGAALLGLGTPALLTKHHQHHRHSLTTRHRVLRTRSSGATQNIWDEQLMEHLAAYSPISTRSHRINPVSSYQVQAALAASRRRESMNSSIGAASIRRLITLNNRNCRHKIPPHVRHKVCQSFICIAVAHGLICGVLLPLFALQGSNSVWHQREQWVHVGPNIGSLLLSGCFLISAVMCLFTKRLIQKFGYTTVIGASYVAASIFLLCHLFPSIFTLLPAYILLGVTYSPSWISKIALVVHFGSKLSCSQHECMLSSSHTTDVIDEHKLFCNRDQKVRRLARWFQVAQDLGIILGTLLASLTLACSSSDWNCFDSSETVSMDTQATLLPSENLTENIVKAVALRSHSYSMTGFLPNIPGYFDDFYYHNEHGERICGADMCPVWHQDNTFDDTSNGTNETIYTQFINERSTGGGITLISTYLLFTLAAAALSFFGGRIQGTFRRDVHIKGVTDTLLFAGPMAYFVGTEQAYMLGDFLRAFVSCSLGISMVAGALVGMGLMQCIVSCTLSMLLRHTKRIVVILAGFFFQSCLLLALSSWKPSSDDMALFYVLAASWGACNGMWETLLMALITLNHANHVTDVTSPLQGLRFLGLGITFAAHGLMCETPKIITMVIILVISLPAYAMLEIRLEAQRKSQLTNL
ncbi:protein unc-93 homolog A [Bactrocera oleae]|uniref:protein unc-93 homolog A n=1 Tax=Bactrocera oleae TaxID=104688 RepID=UPI00387EB631